MINDNSRADDAHDPCFGCPECERMTGCINVGREHWCFCDVHGLTWMIGSNLFSSWKEESQADWEANRQLLQQYRTVKHDGTDDVEGLASLSGIGIKASSCGAGLLPSPSDLDAERFAKIAQTFHVARLGDGYHVLQVPGTDGSPFKAWPGPFESEYAASLFRDDLLICVSRGDPAEASCSDGIFERFNLAGRLLDCIGAATPESRSLAMKLAAVKPWNERKTGFAEVDDELPF